MLKIEKQTKRLTPLQVMPPGSLGERYELADLISSSPTEFFAECQFELFTVASKLSVSDNSPLRIDLLALDKRGRAVVIISSPVSKLTDLATPIACAAVASQWRPQKLLGHLSTEQREKLKMFLDVDVDTINQEQSVILLAEDYSEKELTAVKWLRGRYNIDIRCLCIVSAVDSEQNEYLSCRDLTETSEMRHTTEEANSEPGQVATDSSTIPPQEVAV